MKNTNAHRGLHLVTAEEAAVVAQQPQQGTPAESNRFVTTLVQYYRELKQELEGLCDEQDQARIIGLRTKKKAVRQCLAAYGVRVRA